MPKTLNAHRVLRCIRITAVATSAALSALEQVSVQHASPIERRSDTEQPRPGALSVHAFVPSCCVADRNVSGVDVKRRDTAFELALSPCPFIGVFAAFIESLYFENWGGALQLHGLQGAHPPAGAGCSQY